MSSSSSQEDTTTIRHPPFAVFDNNFDTSALSGPEVVEYEQSLFVKQFLEKVLFKWGTTLSVEQVPGEDKNGTLWEMTIHITGYRHWLVAKHKVDSDLHVSINEARLLNTFFNGLRYFLCDSEFIQVLYLKNQKQSDRIADYVVHLLHRFIEIDKEGRRGNAAGAARSATGKKFWNSHRDYIYGHLKKIKPGVPVDAVSSPLKPQPLGSIESSAAAAPDLATQLQLVFGVEAPAPAVCPTMEQPELSAAVLAQLIADSINNNGKDVDLFAAPVPTREPSDADLAPYINVAPARKPNENDCLVNIFGQHTIIWPPAPDTMPGPLHLFKIGEALLLSNPRSTMICAFFYWLCEKLGTHLFIELEKNDVELQPNAKNDDDEDDDISIIRLSLADWNWNDSLKMEAELLESLFNNFKERLLIPEDCLLINERSSQDLIKSNAMLTSDLLTIVAPWQFKGSSSKKTWHYVDYVRDVKEFWKTHSGPKALPNLPNPNRPNKSRKRPAPAGTKDENGELPSPVPRKKTPLSIVKRNRATKAAAVEASLTLELHQLKAESASKPELRSIHTIGGECKVITNMNSFPVPTTSTPFGTNACIFFDSLFKYTGMTMDMEQTLIDGFPQELVQVTLSEIPRDVFIVKHQARNSGSDLLCDILKSVIDEMTDMDMIMPELLERMASTMEKGLLAKWAARVATLLEMFRDNGANVDTDAFWAKSGSL